MIPESLLPKVEEKSENTKKKKFTNLTLAIQQEL